MSNMRAEAIRGILNVGVLMGILFAPIWVPLIGAVLLALRWRAWEIIGYGVLVDLLYLSAGGIFGIPVVATILMLVLLWGLEPLRRAFLR